ncbi:CG18278 [Drosophila busckii]|uniref:CG18278 n=1 Tax=Drosophila busckii TaxID=30019 RepID=A0A0M4EIG2_DROBS|nr:CG18278 [Drosophila busckii]
MIRIASILTGQYAHNHRTINNSISGGCNGQFWRHTSEPQALPVLLQRHGYRTFFAGKYLNQYEGAEVPPGWQQFYGLHGNSRYYNYTLRENAHNVSYTDTYLTDLLSERAVEFIKSNGSSPFFAMIAPPAAHAPFTPAPRHAGAFALVHALRTPSFNAPAEDKHWLLSSGDKLDNVTVARIDKYFQQRWETLLAVDELVANVVAALNATSVLNNTFIIYASDNGYHMGQFAQPFDKRQPYETDTRVPLLIRGPGVPAGEYAHMPVSLLDLAPTMLEWVGLQAPSHMDGRSFGAQLQSPPPVNAAQLERTLLIEYWGEGNDDTYNPECPQQRSDHLAQCTPQAQCHCQDAWNNTYACVRDFRYKLNRIYCEFRDHENFVEAYDLYEDPYQLRNIANDLLPIERALYGIQLRKLSKCVGNKCWT